MNACKLVVLAVGALLLGLVATTSAQALIAANGENINGVSHSGVVTPDQITLGAKVLSVMLPPVKVQ